MSMINISMSTSDGRSIEICREFLSAEIKPGVTELEEYIKSIKELNKAIEIFQKEETPEHSAKATKNEEPVDSKPEEYFVPYDSNCKYCKKLLQLIGSGKEEEQAQREADPFSPGYF